MTNIQNFTLFSNFTSFIKVLLLFLGLFFFILALILVIYLTLYTLKGITINKLSFGCFTFSIIIFVAFSISSLLLILNPVPSIFLEDLSTFAYYKYTTFLFICVIGFMLIALFKYTKAFKQSKILSLVSYPYVKEEIRTILYTWNDTFMGNLCIRLLDFVAVRNNRMIYFILHFLVFNLITLLQSILFANFVFLHGNLKYNLYLLPISFFIWCLRFIDYYFNTFVVQSGNYIRSVLYVKLNSSPIARTATGIVTLHVSDLSCKLTDYGIAEGFTEHDMSYLATKWLQLNHITIDSDKYLKFVAYFKYLNLFLRICSWSGIVYKLSITDVVFNPIATILGKPFLYRSFHSSPVLRAQEARWIRPQNRAEFEKTFPGLKGDHPVVVDPALKDDNDFIPLYTQGSHFLPNNRSKEIHPTKDFQGNPRAQYGVFLDGITTISEKWTYNTIPGSAQVLQEEVSRVNMARHTTYPQNDDDFPYR